MPNSMWGARAEQPDTARSLVAAVNWNGTTQRQSPEECEHYVLAAVWLNDTTEHRCCGVLTPRRVVGQVRIAGAGMRSQRSDPPQL
jgi:hypothetical protein